MKQIINKLLKPLNIEIHGKGYLQAFAKSEFKKDAFQIQKEILNNRDVKTIFDIGANRGDVLQNYLNTFPNATIHCFEPFPTSFLQLQERYLNNKRVLLNQIAISNSVSKSEMFVNSNVDTNSLLKSVETGLTSDKQVKNVSKIEVNTTTIDEYCLKNNIHLIDILKMDIQGGEYNALLGAESMLNSKSIDLIFTESYFVKQYDNQPLFYDIAQLLFNKEFFLQDIYYPIYGKGKLAWCDVIFIPGK